MTNQGAGDDGGMDDRENGNCDEREEGRGERSKNTSTATEDKSNIENNKKQLSDGNGASGLCVDDCIEVEEEPREERLDGQVFAASSASSSIENYFDQGPFRHHQHQHLNHHQMETDRVSKKLSRLRRATQTLLMFRRVATAGSTSNESGQLDELDTKIKPREHRNSTARVHQLAATFSSFWRQNANSESSLTTSCASGMPSQGRRPSNRPSSLAEADAHLNPQQHSKQDLNDKRDPIGSTTCLPRFIVPKMNALKLPIVCLIKSLDGELMREIFVHRYELGQYIMDNLKVSFDISDAKYFGLKMASSLEDQENVRQPWLDLNEAVCKQIGKFVAAAATPSSWNSNGGPGTVPRALAGNSSPGDKNDNGKQILKSVELYLRIKYYPPNLARVQDPFLRQYLFLQLRRDLRLGKLTSSMDNLTQLMACILQFELGDYKPELVNEQVCHMNILPNQDMIEQKALSIWQERLNGLRRHQIQMQFLRASVILETYGFDYYPVRDHQRQRGYLLGFNYAGVKTIRNGRIVHHFRWHSMSKISYERRMIIFHIYPTENSKRKQVLGFKCLSNEECHNLYIRLLEQKYFFTVDLAYFDKSVRRPSYLTESSVNSGQQAAGLDWSAPTIDELQLRDGHDNDCDDGAMDQQGFAGRRTVAQNDSSQQRNRSDFYGQADEPADTKSNARPLDEQAALFGRDLDEEAGALQANRAESGHARPSRVQPGRLLYQSESLESCPMEIGGSSIKNGTAPPACSPQPELAYSQSTLDDCPDCRQAQHEHLSQQRQHSISNAPLIGGQLHGLPSLTKTTSLQEQHHGARFDERPLFFHQNVSAATAPSASASSLCSVGLGSQHRQCSFESSTSSNDQFSSSSPAPLIRQPLLATTAATSSTSKALMGRRSNQRASLQRQRSTWAHSPSPLESIANEEPPAAHRDSVESSTIARRRLVEWIEWLFVEPILQAGCWNLPLAGHSDQSPGGRYQAGAASSKILLVQAFRFCMFVVMLNLLVRLSDSLTSSLAELITFRPNQRHELGSATCQTDCDWPSDLAT